MTQFWRALQLVIDILHNSLIDRICASDRRSIIRKNLMEDAPGGTELITIEQTIVSLFHFYYIN